MQAIIHFFLVVAERETQNNHRIQLRNICAEQALEISHQCVIEGSEREGEKGREPEREKKGVMRSVIFF